jgi:diguanylate cyclase (GGDEF)-like protein
MINHRNRPLNFSIIPKGDKKQALRVRRGLYALLGAFIHTIICYLLFEDEIFRVTGKEFIVLFSVMWLVHIFFFSMLRSGLNKRFKDPSLTLPIMLWAISSLMFTVYLTNELRAVLLMFYMLTLVFGVFRLNLFEYILTALYGILLYFIIILVLIYYHPIFIQPQKEWVVFACFFMIAITFAIVSAEMNGIMNHLRFKNEKLSLALGYIRSISMTDDLTGIKNRRYILNTLEHQRLLCERGRYTFSVCMFDLDHFKEINDVYGHHVGDLLLKQISREILEQTRKIDHFARIGGEEFLLVLPFSDEEHAQKIAERIRLKIENARFEEILFDRTMTISVGVTGFHWPEEIDITLARVDAALYAAKRSGRNRVIVN